MAHQKMGDILRQVGRSDEARAQYQSALRLIEGPTATAPRDRAAARRAGVPTEAPGVRWLDLDDRSALARAYGAAWLSVLPAPDSP